MNRREPDLRLRLRRKHSLGFARWLSVNPCFGCSNAIDPFKCGCADAASGHPLDLKPRGIQLAATACSRVYVDDTVNAEHFVCFSQRPLYKHHAMREADGRDKPDNLHHKIPICATNTHTQRKRMRA